jgi:hypothetical protein
LGPLRVRSVQVGPVELSKSCLAKTQACTKTELVLGAIYIPRNCFSVSWERQKCSQEQFWYSWEHLTSVYLMGVHLMGMHLIGVHLIGVNL